MRKSHLGMPVYYAPGSSSVASHLALEEAGTKYALKFVNEDAGEQHSEAYLRINPRGEVPALRLTDGTVLVENIAIQTYVARIHPEAKLLPENSVGKARARSLKGFLRERRPSRLLVSLATGTLHR